MPKIMDFYVLLIILVKTWVVQYDQKFIDQKKCFCYRWTLKKEIQKKSRSNLTGNKIVDKITGIVSGK